MPMFDYRCKACDNIFEELVQSCEVPDDDIICPECGKNQSERLISAPSISTGSMSSDSNYARPPCGASTGFS
jgi:putative FmdB family regulatory protein